MDADMEVLENRGKYPPGIAGEWAGGYYLDETRWALMRVSTQEIAKTKLPEIIGSEKVQRVPLKSGPKKGIASAVAWTAFCNGGSHTRISPRALCRVSRRFSASR